MARLERSDWEILVRCASLTDRQSTAFLRCVVDGLDAAAVALEMETSTANVRNAVLEAQNILTSERWTDEEVQFITSRLYERREAVENGWRAILESLIGPRTHPPPTPVFDENENRVVLNTPWWKRALR